MPPARPLRAALAALAAVLLAVGCGSSDGDGYGAGDSTAAAPTATATTPAAPAGGAARDCGATTVAGVEQLSVTGMGCASGRDVVVRWAAEPACSPPQGASRFSCGLGGGYRCLGVATGRGLAISCSRPGASLAFLAERD